MDEISIVGFDEKYSADFARLNYEWIDKYFGAEQHDRDMLDDPLNYIIKFGGEIFFAVCDGEAVGTVAMISAPHNMSELAKMAVSPAFHGRGIADKLMTACIEHAKSAGKRAIWLESNTKLEPAIKLYRKHGFVETPLDKNSLYSRCNIQMELAIDRRDV
jgi:ribosomal protein S18 acetylase RimI-like enzyme